MHTEKHSGLFFKPEVFFIAYLLALILLGVVFRLAWVNWSQGTNLHPDEYGLTNTLTQLSLPQDISGYFNTRQSPLSPYPKYDLQGSLVANGPDNRMRWGQWPMILIRTMAELTGNTGYNELRLMGRTLSALADILTLCLTFLIGWKLYNWKTGLLATAFSALAVMQIQQSHFMTVDNFSVLFAVLAMLACVMIARAPGALRRTPGGEDRVSGYQINRKSLLWYALFGVFFGMAVASKINLLPLGGMVLIAAFISIADLKLKTRSDLPVILAITAGCLALAVLAALIAFRVTQPMSFRASTGDTTFFTIHLNQDWVESMKLAQAESSGIGGGPPAEQWAHRIPIVFPLVNMVLWGMGLPLGLLVWACFLWAAWMLVRHGDRWKSHLLPLVWIGGYFLFMGTRWAPSIRYFLPVYPFLCILAAWGLLELWERRARGIGQDQPALNPRTPVRRGGILPAALILFFTLGTLSWALAFVNAVYRQDHTRIQANKWIIQNIPAPFHLSLESNGQAYFEPVPAPDNLQILRGLAYIQPFTSSQNGVLSGVLIPHALAVAGESRLQVLIAADSNGSQPVDQAEVIVHAQANQPAGSEAQGSFHGASLEKGKTYYLIAEVLNDAPVVVSRTVIANESWDEGLPMPYAGRDPFGQFYRGVTMEVRWYDDANKLKMFLDSIAQVDYILLPSQRGIWTTCRIPRTYPMTILYYRSLFNGQLGFDRVATFTSPLKLGPLELSDVAGTAAWNRTPALPVFNNNILAAEEAFSVYDHPPVWVFKKRADFNLSSVQKLLSSVDLSKVVIQTARNATPPPCP